MVIRRLGPLSFAKIAGVLYALMGFIIGAIISAVSVVGGAFAAVNEGSGFPGMLFGAAAVVVLPIVYGLLGFVVTLIGAALYNLAAGWVGGVELDVQ